MRKLLYRILLPLIILFIVVLSAFLFFAVNSSVTSLNASTEAMLLSTTESWAREFEGFFKKQLATVSSYKAIVEDNLTLEILSNSQLFANYIEEQKKIAAPVVRDMKLTTLYTWFAPEYTAEKQMFSVRNLKQDGNISYATDTTYSREDIINDDWKWFYLTEEYGTYITEPYFWEEFNSDIVSICKSVIVENQTVGIIGTDSLIGDLKQLLLSQKFMNNGYYALLNPDLDFIAHPVKENEGKPFSDFFPEDYSSVEESLKNEASIEGIFYSGSQVFGYTRLSTGWILLAVPYMDEINESVNNLIKLLVIIFAAALIVVVIISIILSRSISQPVSDVAAVLSRISDGYLDSSADSRYTARQDEVGTLAKSLNLMVENLKETIQNISSSADQVSSGSSEISSTAQELSKGTSTQASSTEEISASMEELVSNIEQNSENAENSSSVAKAATGKASEGGSAVNDTVDAMKIITEKIAIIEEIARNTNLLALNAAIEAARAGEAGKGFAVVADEVRKLAGRSQEASTEITEISSSSVQRALKAGELINSLLPDIEKTSVLVQEISHAGMEQNTGAEQVNSGISQLNEVIQQNAAISEELAAMAEELNAQADSMKGAISFFKIDQQQKLIGSAPAHREN